MNCINTKCKYYVPLLKDPYGKFDCPGIYFTGAQGICKLNYCKKNRKKGKKEMKDSSLVRTYDLVHDLRS